VIVDTSVIIAILRGETDAAALGKALGRPRPRRMSVVSYVEAAVVVDSNRNPILSRRLDDLLRDVQIEVEPVTLRVKRIATSARGDIEQALTLAIASRMLWQRRRARHCCSKATIFATPTLSL
jgi:ribonuclease VapC